MRASHIFAFVAAGVIAAAAWFGWTMTRGGRGEARFEPVETRIGATRLRLPAGYLRNGENAGAMVEALDLLARFPDFRPVDGGARQDASALVFIRLRASDDSLEPSERTARLYARFLEKDEWTHPGGLLMRRFENGSPYEREELYFAPPEGRLFWARCARPAPTPDGVPSTCIHEFRAHGLDAQVRFAPELLSEWEALTNGARGLVESMTR